MESFTLSYNADSGAWSLNIERSGHYRANDATYALALAMGKRGMLRRMSDVWEGESEAPEIMRRYRALPAEVLAVIVADCTYSLEDWTEAKPASDDAEEIISKSDPICDVFRREASGWRKLAKLRASKAKTAIWLAGSHYSRLIAIGPDGVCEAATRRDDVGRNLSLIELDPETVR